MKREILLRWWAVGGLAIFLGMSISVELGIVQPLDQGISQQLNGFHHPWLDAGVIALTRLGSPPALLLITLFFIFYCLYRKQRRPIGVFLLSVWGTAIVTSLVKVLVQRPRPTQRLVEIYSPSFPSWHSATSMALAITLWAFFSPKYGRRANWIFLWPMLIGGSRIWLNAHWCSDVLAGWGLGAFVASLSLLLFQNRHKRMESRD